MQDRLIKSMIMALWIWGGMISGANLYAQEYPLNNILNTKMHVHAIEVISSHLHDSEAYTQGLLVHGGYIYESTGLYGKSGIFKKDIKTGKTLQELRIDGGYFGEGLVIFQDKIYQLTWQNETLIVYDAESFKELKKIKYQGEGWGLTANGRYLFMSNGSSILSVRDPKTFKVIREIHVRDGDKPIDRLNELEFVNGEIWANIYLEDWVARISPKSGKVRGWIDLSSLRTYLPRNAQVDVINGIAYDSEKDRIYVTGKLWPKLFEIKIKEKISKKP